MADAFDRAWRFGAACAFVMAGAGAFLVGGAAHAGVVKPSEEALRAAGDHFEFARWNALLERYVDGKGRVDYHRLKATPKDMAELETLYAEVAKQRLDALPSAKAREAFLIDAYNVCVWKGVVERLPKMKSVDDEKVSFFFFTKYVVAGREINLRDLEGDAIRPVFHDPRVHMALNCASAGCPELPAEAFEPATLDAQLDREVRKFVGEERNVAWDPATRTVTLSKIFDWYDKDFAKQQVAWIDRYRAQDRQIPVDAKVKFRDYDWRLNDLSLPR